MQANIRCITKACQRIGLEYRFIDANKNCLEVAGELYFQLNRSPFNIESMAALCKDKEHHYNMLKDRVNIPKTIGFLDFDSKDIYQEYLTYDSLDKVVAAIEANFDYPVVVKQNKGALGINVFCCKEQAQIKQAIRQIFDKQSPDYDYVALAQSYVKAKQEFRVICFDGQPVLSYERVFGKTDFGARYWETDKGKAMPVENNALIERVAKEFAPALTLKGLRFVALDIIIDHDDNLHLIELNSGPQVNNYISSNGEAPVVDMYEHILKTYLN